MSDPDDPQAWIAKAENDLLCIDNNLNDPRVTWDAVCFHAQQAAEKTLKAFPISRGSPIRRTHDLVTLLRECVDAGAAFAMLESDCRLLNPFAVALRYPGSLVEPSSEEAQHAVKAARHIHLTVLETFQSNRG